MNGLPGLPGKFNIWPTMIWCKNVTQYRKIKAGTRHRKNRTRPSVGLPPGQHSSHRTNFKIGFSSKAYMVSILLITNHQVQLLSRTMLYQSLRTLLLPFLLWLLSWKCMLTCKFLNLCQFFTTVYQDLPPGNLGLQSWPGPDYPCISQIRIQWKASFLAE